MPTLEIVRKADLEETLLTHFQNRNITLLQNSGDVVIKTFSVSQDETAFLYRCIAFVVLDIYIYFCCAYKTICKAKSLALFRFI